MVRFYFFFRFSKTIFKIIQLKKVLWTPVLPKVMFQKMIFKMFCDYASMGLNIKAFLAKGASLKGELLALLGNIRPG